MGVTEYAKHRGCDLKTVQEACDAGRISYTMSGNRKRINPHTADTEWDRNTDPKKNHYSNLDDIKNNSRYPAFQESRAVREAYQARITKLEYEQKRGALIEKEKVRRYAINTANLIKNNLRQIPIKVSAELAAETSKHTIEMRILREIDECLEELSRYETRV